MDNTNKENLTHIEEQENKVPEGQVQISQEEENNLEKEGFETRED